MPMSSYQAWVVLALKSLRILFWAGAKSVIVHDCGKVDYPDLSSQVCKTHSTILIDFVLISFCQYYFTESDIGHNRAEITLRKLSELNNYVTVTSSSEIIDEAFLTKNKVNVRFQ